jgi:hypothetical protein
MAVEIKVVQKPQINPTDWGSWSKNWPLLADQYVKGATPISNVSEFVSLTLQTAADKGQIDFIQINGHGNNTGFRIGWDWIDLKSIENHKENLAKIAPVLSKTCGVEVAACYAGETQELMRRFSHILGGVSIIGYLMLQPGGGPAVGPPVIVTPGGSYSPPRPAAGSAPPPPAPPK